MDKKGFFTVSSAYKLAYATRRQPTPVAEASNAGAERRTMWRQVWKLPIKPKLKLFLWKCLHNWLATGSAVKGRGMEIDDTCRRCGIAKETREHLFFNCPESVLIWKLAPLQWDGIQMREEFFEEWWRSLCIANHDSVFCQRMELTIYLLWSVWKARCAWQFDHQKCAAHEVVQRAVKEWQEFDLSRKSAAALSASSEQQELHMRCVGADSPATLYLNVATEVNHQGTIIGVGWILSSVQGEVIFTASAVCTNSGSASLAELEGIQDALRMARTWKARRIEVRLEERIVGAWLLGKIPPTSEAVHLVDNIFLLRKQFDLCSFVFVLKDWNLESHHLARLGLANR